MSTENTPPLPQGVRLVHTEMLISHNYNGEDPRTVRVGSILLYILGFLFVGGTYITVPYQLNIAATLTAMALVIAVTTPWHLWCAGLDRIYPRPELDTFQQRAIMRGAQVVLTDHGYVFYDPQGIADRLRADHEAEGPHRWLTAPPETPAASAPAPRPAPTPAQDPAQLRADTIAQIQAGLAELDQLWLAHQMDPQDYFLDRPLLHDPKGFPPAATMNASWDNARELIGALVDPQAATENQVTEAEKVLRQAHADYDHAHAEAGRLGTQTFTPAVAGALRRAKGFLAQIADISSTEHERQTALSRLRREIEKIGTEHFPAQFIELQALPTEATQELLLAIEA